MKFTTAWAKVTIENITLKVAVVVLATVTAILSVVSAMLALKEPLVVERGCYTKSLHTVDTKRTPQEIEFFLREALSQRFDSTVSLNRDYFSESETGFRDQEQKSLAQKSIRQRVVVNSVNTEKDPILVDADRILSVGSVRSALPFPVSVKISSVDRTEANPYGLRLENIDQVKEGKK